MNGSSGAERSESWSSSCRSRSSHCIAKEWTPIQAATQYVERIWLFLPLMLRCRFLSEWKWPLRNPIACSDHMCTLDTCLLNSSLSGRSCSGFL
jgi:hypothetical protein